MKQKLTRLIAKHGLSKYRENLLSLAAPGLKLKTKPLGSKSLPRGATKLGGAPDVPPGFLWPKRRGRPLAFIGQIDLRASRAVVPWPDTGHLLFFYDAKEQPWGFDPKDRGSWAIVHVADSRKSRPMSMPLGSRRAAPEPWEGGPLNACSVVATKVLTLPPPENMCLEAILVSEKARAAYAALYEEHAAPMDHPHHQVGGWPQIVQSDMEVECQLASHGIDCGGMVDINPLRLAAFISGSARWQMLLQICSDDNLGCAWGDVGMLYFYATAETRAREDFKETWTILQCG